MSLRNDLIRLAHADPEVRDAVLPALKEAYPREKYRPTKSHYHDWMLSSDGSWGLLRDDGSIALVEKGFGGWRVKIDRQPVGTKAYIEDAFALGERKASDKEAYQLGFRWVGDKTWEFPRMGASKPAVVSENDRGILECTCEGYRWSKQRPRTCKHVRAVEAELGRRASKQASLHSKLVRLAHDKPELRDTLMPLLVAPVVTFGKAAAEQRPRPYAQDTIVEQLHSELYKLADEHRLGNGRAPDGTGALEFQIRFLRASSKRTLPWIYDHIVHTARSVIAQSPVLEPVAKKVIKEAEARSKEWSERNLAERSKREHA